MHVHFARLPGESLTYEAIAPAVHVQLTPPESSAVWKFAASAEYDDRPGAVRDLLVAGQRELRGAIAKAIRLAIDEGHLNPQTDPWQLTFELFGIVLATHHDLRLLADARALERASDALERLIDAHSWVLEPSVPAAG